MLSSMGEQGLRLGIADDKGNDQVTPDRIRTSGDGNILNAGAGGQTGLDFLRMHIAPAADQHVVGSPKDAQVAAVIELAEVAGGQPALGTRSAALNIASHDLRPANANAAIGVDADFMAGHGQPDPAFRPLAIGGIKCRDLGGCLAHAVTGVKRPANGDGPLVKCLRQGGAADHGNAQAGWWHGADVE